MLTVFGWAAIVVLAVAGVALGAVSGAEQERGNTYRAEGNVGLALIALAIALAASL